MTTSKAMDRLLCGDVGYGKTEVAMRAALKPLLKEKNKLQFSFPPLFYACSILRPFRQDVELSIIVKAVSRFQSVKEVKQILKELSEGKIDILVGTHRLLSKDVKFKDLGLIIIDEEQKFGVRSKEHLKALKAGVDCSDTDCNTNPPDFISFVSGCQRNLRDQYTSARSATHQDDAH